MLIFFEGLCKFDTNLISYVSLTLKKGAYAPLYDFLTHYY